MMEQLSSLPARARSSIWTAQLPESIDRVKALVCNRCWTDCFDTAAFETVIGLGDGILSYTCSGEELMISSEEQCPWCSSLLADESFQIEMNPQMIYTISITKSITDVFTPKGSNVFMIKVQASPNLRSYCQIVLSRNSHQFDKPGLSHVHHVEWFTQEANIAADKVTAREIQTDVSPPNAREQTLEWLNECADHRCCPKQIDFPLPTRLIEVNMLQIVTTDGKLGKYAALSYCWGDSSQVLLKKSNFQEFTRQLNFDGLPQTIKDAILVARSLCIPYLWVDTLCIIQDSEADKAHEISLMAKVYGNAYVTIVASSAKSASEGFLELRKSNSEQFEHFTLPFRISNGMFGSVTVRKFSNFVDERRKEWERKEPIDERAWTLQEQLIASRLLLYRSHTLHWQCAATAKNLGQSLRIALPLSARMLSQVSMDPETAYHEWMDMLRNYSSRTTSFPDDKLPAIAALAERFAPTLGQYHAGIWSYSIIKQLMWQQWPLPPVSKLDSSIYRAPSWSWASLDGQLRLGTSGPHLEEYCTFVSADTLLKEEVVPFGEVLGGLLKIRAKLLLLWVGLQKPTPSKDPSPASRAAEATVCVNQYIQEPASTRFSKAHSEQTFSEASRIGNKAIVLSLGFDGQRTDHSPGLVCLLPLVTEPHIMSYVREYDNYRSGPDGDMPMCSGLILVPAGSSTFKRIGTFEVLHPCELDGIPMQEITIV